MNGDFVCRRCGEWLESDPWERDGCCEDCEDQDTAILERRYRDERAVPTEGDDEDL